MGMSLSKLWEFVIDREAWRAAIHGVEVRHDWATELNWTEMLPTTSFQKLIVVLFLCLLGFLCVYLKKLEPWLLSSCLMFSDLSGSLSISFWSHLTWSFMGFSSWHWLTYVLVHLSCSKILQTGWCRNSKNLLFTFLESESTRSGAGTIKFK